MPASSAAEAIGIVKDLMLTVAGFVGAIVAVYGLDTWNRQLKGGVEYELTRRLLKCTYRLREAIKGVRDPMVTSSEQVLSESDQQQPEEIKRYLGIVSAYLKRWESVGTVRTDLQTELLEAEVIWGNEIRDKFDPLLKLQHELYVSVRSFLTHSDPRLSEETRDAWFKVRQQRRDVLYDISVSGAYADPYSDDIEKAIKEIESYLKPHLAK